MDEVWEVVDSRGYAFCNYDAIESVQDSSSAQIPTEPQENAALYAYNKVPEPSDVSVTLLFGGDYAQQQQALSMIEGYRSSTELFSILTPSRIFQRMAVVGYSSQRAATNGVNMLSISVQFREVRMATVQSAAAQWQPKNATSANLQDQGKRSTKSPENVSMLKGGWNSLFGD